MCVCRVICGRNDLLRLAVFRLWFAVFCGLEIVICDITTSIWGLPGMICGDLRSSMNDMRWFAVIFGLPGLICGRLAVFRLWFVVFCGLGIVIGGLQTYWFVVFREWFAVIFGIQADPFHAPLLEITRINGPPSSESFPKLLFPADFRTAYWIVR